MALLGGLLRGTSGAFIRGSLGAASDMLQQAAARDEEKITQGVEAFGGKYSTYQEKMSEYNAQTDMINEVSNFLKGQEDPRFAKYNDAQFSDLAESLIQQSGAEKAADATEFFVNNANTLQPTELDLPSTDVAAQETAPTTGANVQTNALLNEQEQKTKDGPFTFLKRAFGGRSQDELDAAIAAKAGVSPEMYSRVMDGFNMTREPRTVGLSRKIPSKTDEVVNEMHVEVLKAVRQGQPVYQTDQATAAQSYVKDYAKFLEGGAGAMTASDMLARQSSILTASAPPDFKEYLEVYNPYMKSIGDVLLNESTPQNVIDGNIDEFNELMRMQLLAVNPNTRGQIDEKKAADFGKRVMNLFKTVRPTEDEFSNVFDVTKELLTAAIDDVGKYYKYMDVDDINLVLSMQGQLGVAMKEKDTNVLYGIMNTLSGVNRTIPDDATDASPYEVKKNDLISVIMAEDEGISKEDAELRAIRILQMNDNDVVMVRGMPYGFKVVDGVRVAVPIPTGDIKSDAGGAETFVPAPDMKTQEELRKKLTINNTAILQSGSNMQILARYGNALNFVGRMRVEGMNIADIVTSLPMFDGVRMMPGYQALQADARAINKVQREVIPAISAAKDLLFDDPRLSDQDLKIVLDYVAVINNNTIGQTVAMEAILGFQQAMLNDTGLITYQLNRDMEVAKYNKSGRMAFFRQDGSIDDSTIAGRLFQQVAGAQGFKMKSKQEIDALPPEEQKAFMLQYRGLEKMVERSVREVESLQAVKGDIKQYRELRNTQQSTLQPLSVVPANYREQGASEVQDLADALAEAREKRAARMIAEGEVTGLGM